MSPAQPPPIPGALNLKFAELVHELHDCHELCMAIRQRRDVGTSHTHLDQLEASLPDINKKIQERFAALAQRDGPWFLAGDEEALRELDGCTQTLKEELKSKMLGIASRYQNQQHRQHRQHQRDRNQSGKESPGFREMGRHLSTVEEKLLRALEALSNRIRTADVQAVESQHWSTPNQLDTRAPPNETHYAARTPPLPQIQSQSQHQQGEALSLEDMARISIPQLFSNPLRDCWVEELTPTGRNFYRNVLTGVTQWEKPDGFVKEIPRSPRGRRRRTSWEGTSSERDPSWRPRSYRSM